MNPSGSIPRLGRVFLAPRLSAANQTMFDDLARAAHTAMTQGDVPEGITGRRRGHAGHGFRQVLERAPAEQARVAPVFGIIYSATRNGGRMRSAYIALIVLVTAAVLVFKLQNLTSVTVTFLTMSVTLPVVLFILIVYVLGMISGGALWSLLRTAARGAFERR